jgi:hypothetical protein
VKFLLDPPILTGGSFSISREGSAVSLRRLEYEKDPIVGNNESRRLAFRQPTATEFACLSSSRQLMLLTILRAQLSSRKAIAATAEWGRRQGDF